MDTFDHGGSALHHATGGPRLYHDLTDLWRFVSPPENYAEEVSTFLTRFRRHGVPDGGTVLHLGSGGGSIDWHLKRTYRVTGVDVAPAMLEYAARLNPEVEYAAGDIRAVRLGRTFDAVLLHDAISYMTTAEDLARAYRTAAEHLEPGGVMVTLPEELPHRVVHDAAEAETHRDGETTVTVVTTTFDEDPADHRLETVFLFLIRQGAALRVEVDRHVTGVFTLDEFTAAMRAAGFDAHVEPWELTDWTPGLEMPLITAVKR